MIFRDYSQMYLRGVFNWWEANESFKLTPTSENQYSVTIELIADGQPYDFKVADEIWSMALNCGNYYNSEALKLNEERTLVCADNSSNLQYTPSETALYLFTLDVSDNQNPVLKVSKVD